MAVVGEKEAESGTVAIRSRDTAQTVTLPLADFIAQISKEIADRV